MAVRSPKAEYRYKGVRLRFTRTLIMGIVNVTPDSFSDGGKFLSPEDALAQAAELAGQGADILDIGGESSRPGADPVSLEEELGRVIPVIHAIHKAMPKMAVSIDTYKPAVAKAALDAGAAIINDISGLRDPQMEALAAKTKAPVVVMHMKGTPQDMQIRPAYKDVVKEIRDYFKKRVRKLESLGITKIILDPGIGFGKTANHNLAILGGLEEIVNLGYPVMVGASRKSFIGKSLGARLEDREIGGAAANAIAIAKGASVIRVHDVRLHRQAAIMADCIRSGKKPVDRKP